MCKTLYVLAKNLADNGIRTLDLWFRKQPLWQLPFNECSVGADFLPKSDIYEISLDHKLPPLNKKNLAQKAPNSFRVVANIIKRFPMEISMSEFPQKFQVPFTRPKTGLIPWKRNLNY